MDTIMSALEKMEWLIKWLCVALVISLAALVFIYVIMRYFFNNPIVWYDEVVSMIIMGLTYFGSALASANRGHIYVEIVEDALIRKFPTLGRFWRALTDCVVFVFLLLVVWIGFQLAFESKDQITGVLLLSYFWIYLILPVGVICMLLMTAKSIIKEISAKRLNGEQTVSTGHF